MPISGVYPGRIPCHLREPRPPPSIDTCQSGAPCGISRRKAYTVVMLGDDVDHVYGWPLARDTQPWF